MNTREQKKNYLRAVKDKLNTEQTRTLLSFGNTKGVGPRIRDSQGLLMTFSTILNSANNLFTVTEGRDEFSRAVHNFSASSEGYSQVSDVKTVGAIDITIIALSNSLIPFLCVDRPMDTPDTTVYYNNLIALNTAGGVTAADVVSGNFAVPNPAVDLGASAVMTVVGTNTLTTLTASFGTGLIKKSVVISLTIGGTVYTTGQDFMGNNLTPATGQIIMLTPGVYTGVVNYDTGVVTMTKSGGNFGVTDSVTVTAERNMTQGDGAKVLRVVSDWVNVTLHSEPKNIVVEDNLANRMYMNKVNTLAGSPQNVNDTLFARTKNTYIEYLNILVLNTLKAAATTDSVQIDLSSYDVSKFSATKNDIVALAISNLIAKFQGKTGLLPTIMITGSYGVSLLSSIQNMWVPNPDVSQGVNGLAGYFNGMPVYRHSSINTSTSGLVSYYMAVKLPDNMSGSLVYGEFLPLTSTGVVSNFMMPSNIASGYFSQCGVKLTNSNLAMRGSVLLPTALFNATGLV